MTPAIDCSVADPFYPLFSREVGRNWIAQREMLYRHIAIPGANPCSGTEAGHGYAGGGDRGAIVD